MSRKTRQQGHSEPKTAAPSVVPKPLGPSFDVTLTFLSDWHVGAGVGRPGDVHALIQRDQDDLPFVPAKTLTGIWRDACERVALGLDNGTAGPWWRWVMYLFGDEPGVKAQPGEVVHQDQSAPEPAALSVRPARLPETLRSALLDAPDLLPSLTFVKPGVSIDPRSGRAREDFLRFEEMARSGSTLQTPCELKDRGSQEQRLAATALLLAGARLVEHLGGKRRRGQGRCRLVVAGISDISSWLDWIEHQSVPLPPDPSKDRNQPAAHPAPRSGGWLQFELRLTAKAPLLIASRASGHLVRGLDYIPGTYLLPLLSLRLAGLGIDFREAMGRGDLIVTHAYVEIAGQRGTPVPLVLGHDKLGGGLEHGRGVYNRFVEQTKDLQIKPESGYIVQDGLPLPSWRSVVLQLQGHNTIEDTSQRPTAEVGGLYHYEAIPQGTCLRMRIRLRPALATLLAVRKAEWWQDLAGPCRLGKSKKDDYGRVLVETVAAPAAYHPRVTVSPGELHVWLLSDLLLRDERLRPCASVGRLAEVLGKRLGVTLIPRSSGTDGTRWSAARSNRVDSWHVSWGLPRPSLVGLAGGTCVVFAVKGGPLDSQVLADIEASGLGERRAEGYGQVRFNDPLLAQALSGKKRPQEEPSDEKKREPGRIGTDDPSFQYARLIEREAWRGVLRRASLAAATESEERRKILGLRQNKPSMSQLGVLRSVLSRMQSPENASLVQNWLRRLKALPNRRDKWPEEALKAIEKIVSDRGHVYALLGLDPRDARGLPVCTSTGADELSNCLWAEAVRTLINACIQAHKRELEMLQAERF